MLSLGQLNDTLPIMKVEYKKFVTNKAKIIYNRTRFKETEPSSDTIQKKALEENVSKSKPYFEALSVKVKSPLLI